MTASLELASIGNCQIAALLDRQARMVWACLPRPDGDPVFCSLLAGDAEPDAGYYDVELMGFVRSEQRYLPNTAIVETVLRDGSGGAVKIIDFAPRFHHHRRFFRPVMLVRMLVPLAGSPRVRVRLRPLGDYGAVRPTLTYGSNHIRFVLPGFTIRLTTDASVTAIVEERAFVLDHPVALVLGPDETLTDSPGGIAHHFLAETRSHWEGWTHGLSVPFEWQDAVIRAAITLKLCTFEDTGAVIAGVTTSIPESPDSGRNWDYRYCWLRDAFFVVQALNRLGATTTMEQYLRYVLNVATETGGRQLQPVYGISGEPRLTERIVASLPGYRGMGPVRVGNQAYEQIQNDVYGAVVMAATQYFFDRRIVTPGGVADLQRLEILGERAVQLFDAPDAGLWEYRGRQRVHTFSSAMCWAAADRLARIARHLGQQDRALYWGAAAERMHAEIARAAWNPQLGCFTESFGRDDVDASALLLPALGFLRADDPRFASTVHVLEQKLRVGKHMRRYTSADDFGLPESAFNICTFWYIDALAAIGRRDEAREIFENMLSCRTSLGLLSEDVDPNTGELWGNFPQTYSMVGIINSAMRLSRPWEDAL
ncbi:MAG TPA: glycoside hydrolase family 15 protein [Gammaproteobacteria bacterium]|jgi:GH15 family glucan-1,4-alpha-glucosidase|nr:glycoside hydrolase family 15 protein [Gammaproteobacteria bacterium]